MVNIYKLKFQRNLTQCSILDLKSFVCVMETKSRPEVEQLQLVLAYDGRLSTSERTCVGHISCYVNVSDRWVGGRRTEGWVGDTEQQCVHTSMIYTHRRWIRPPSIVNQLLHPLYTLCMGTTVLCGHGALIIYSFCPHPLWKTAD